MTTENAVIDAVILPESEILRDLSEVFAPAADQLHPRQYDSQRANARLAAFRPAVAQVIPTIRIADFTECMEIAFGGLILAGALLFGAGLLRLCWVDGETGNAVLRDAARIFYGLAGVVGCGTLFNAGLGLYHLLRK